MNQPEKVAVLLQQQLFEHCKRNGLPIITVIALVSEQQLCRAYTDMEGETLLSFREAVAPILYKNQN